MLQTNLVHPPRLVLRAGFWSAIVIVILFLIFTVSFIAIASLFPIYIRDDLTGYLSYINSYPHPYAYLARLSMLIFAPALLVLSNSVLEIAPPQTKFLARMSTHFSMITAILVSVHYFVQITAVRFSIESGQAESLIQFIQSNPDSVILSINMPGITFFFGLASLYMAFVFGGNRLETVIRWAWIINGVMCIAGGIGYMLQIDWLIFITINFGMGGAVWVACIAMALFFRKKLDESFNSDMQTYPTG